jgi:hypothetical protein
MHAIQGEKETMMIDNYTFGLFLGFIRDKFS